MCIDIGVGDLKALGEIGKMGGVRGISGWYQRGHYGDPPDNCVCVAQGCVFSRTHVVTSFGRYLFSNCCNHSVICLQSCQIRDQRCENDDKGDESC